MKDKYISPATIAKRIVDESRTSLLLKVGGVLGFASERPPASVRVGGEEREWMVRNGLYTVPVPDGESLVEIWR